MKNVFVLCALGFVAGAIYHVVGFIAPTAVEDHERWRHALFVGINLVGVAGFLRRPRWFVYAFAVLVAQQIYGHGLRFWRIWHEEGRTDWSSVIVLLAMPPLLALLVHDAREGPGEKAEPAPSTGN